MKTVRYIEVFERGHQDPETGEELPNRSVTYRKWDKELDRLATVDPKKTFTCVQAEHSDDGLDRRVVHVLHLGRHEAQRWVDEGINVLGGPALAEAFEKSLNPKTKETIVREDTSGMQKLLEEQAELIKTLKTELDELKAQETTSKKTSRK